MRKGRPGKFIQMNYIKAVFSDIDYPIYFSITKYFPNSLWFF